MLDGATVDGAGAPAFLAAAETPAPEKPASTPTPTRRGPGRPRGSKTSKRKPAKTRAATVEPTESVEPAAAAEKTATGFPGLGDLVGGALASALALRASSTALQQNDARWLALARQAPAYRDAIAQATQILVDGYLPNWSPEEPWEHACLVLAVGIVPAALAAFSTPPTPLTDADRAQLTALLNPGGGGAA